jgi:RNA polymerase sigma-70 factor (ECF subfamily)
VTRLCIDHGRSARVRRETYVGPWLPEPLVAAEAAEDPSRDLERAEALSLALLRVLDRLDPVERAVFLLREVFDYPYDEVARVVGRRVDHCRQLARRARQRVRVGRPPAHPDPAEHERLLTRFLEASSAGDFAALEDMLAEDVVLVSDGGGKAKAALRPVLGRDRVSRFVVGVRGKVRGALTVRLASANGLPAALIYVDGALETLVALDVRDGRIVTVFNVRNPDKLPREKPTDGPTATVPEPPAGGTPRPPEPAA